MIFTGYTYAVFLLAAFLIHWLMPNGGRKWFLIACSYLFYASWDWRFCFLLLALTIFNWYYAIHVLRPDRNGALWPGVLVNLAPLLLFKYSPLQLLVPLGISFFTFQAIAYLVDVAAGEAPFGFRDFMLYRAFWPQLIAGPIVRPGEIRAELEGRRVLDYAQCASGAQRIVFGLFKKVVLADALAPIVDSVFVSHTPNAADAGLAVLGFGLQVYFDFSGYSDIAIGSAMLFGFRFPENFEFPYASRSPQEFWNRWHITLSRWVRDYVFTPLAFSTRRRPRLANLWLLVAMIIIGLWHGAQWTFIAWGVWHGLLLIANQTVLKRWFSRKDLLAAVTTFALITAGWLLFRAESLAQAADYVKALVTLRGGVRPSTLRVNDILIILISFAGLLAAQMLRGLSAPRWLRVLRPVVYAALIVAVIILGQEAKSFVYFQF